MIIADESLAEVSSLMHTEQFCEKHPWKLPACIWSSFILSIQIRKISIFDDTCTDVKNSVCAQFC